MLMKLLQQQHPEASPVQEPTIITVGKVNFIINEHFSDSGKEIGELMERLVVDKCRKIS